jgi:hypothetical protein
MLTLIDAYNDYTNKLNDDDYNLDIGIIKFYKSTRHDISIHCIEIAKEQRRKGHFTEKYIS